MRKIFMSVVAVIVGMPLASAGAAETAQPMSVSVQPAAALDVVYVSKDSTRTPLTRTDESGKAVVDFSSISQEVRDLSVMGKASHYVAVAEKCDDGTRRVLIAERGAQKPVREGCRKDEAIVVVLSGGSNGMSTGKKALIAGGAAGLGGAAWVATRSGGASGSSETNSTTSRPSTSTTPTGSSTPTTPTDRRGNYEISITPVSIGCPAFTGASSGMLIVQGPDASGMNVTVIKATSQTASATGNIGSDGSLTVLMRASLNGVDVNERLNLIFNGKNVQGTEEDTFSPTAPQCPNLKNVLSLKGVRP